MQLGINMPQIAVLASMGFEGHINIAAYGDTSTSLMHFLKKGLTNDE
jgi:hypothetical protein